MHRLDEGRLSSFRTFPHLSHALEISRQVILAAAQIAQADPAGDVFLISNDAIVFEASVLGYLGQRGFDRSSRVTPITPGSLDTRL